MLLAALFAWLSAVSASTADTTDFAGFIEPDFPFITVSINADSIGLPSIGPSWAVRGVMLPLDESVYFVFDPDLLRMAFAWTGAGISQTTMAMVSYHTPHEKDDSNPLALGRPIAGTGHYPGWTAYTPTFDDPREPGPDPADPGRGPLPDSLGRYHGLYLRGDDVVFSYSVAGTPIVERPGLVEEPGAVTRTFTVGPSARTLTLAAAEIDTAGRSAAVSADEIVVASGDLSVTSDRAAAIDRTVTNNGDAAAGDRSVDNDRTATNDRAVVTGDTVTYVRVDDLPDGAALEVRRDRYVVLRLPPHQDERVFRVTYWRGPRRDLEHVRAMLEGIDVEAPQTHPVPERRWPQVVETGVRAAPDTAAFVFDDVALPMPNPWRRNVRPADLAFFSDGRAAVVTFDGDVWIVDGLGSPRSRWHRYASGLYEPLALAIKDDLVYAYGREGIVRLRDRDGNGEADFYEAFAPGIVQSTRSREWPSSLVVRPDGGFYATQGGALGWVPGSAYEGFVRGSVHNGTILAVSPDGRDVSIHASGFRGPYAGIHPKSGFLTASDQQGNYVPSSNIYAIHEGAYYGVPPTAHLPAPLPEPMPPLTWIPHRVDPSGTVQVWALTDRLGPLNGRMLHLSYGKPGLYRVYVDTLGSPLQGGIAPIPTPGTKPILKAALHPDDGLLYTVGFQIWGLSTETDAGMHRMRYTGLEHAFPDELAAGRQGILLQFDEPVKVAGPEQFRIRRWNYARSGSYGSGHYRLDGSEGEEVLRAAGVHRSPDGRTLFVVVPDMREVMQMSVAYHIAEIDGDTLGGTVYLTVNDVRDLDLARLGLAHADWEGDVRRAGDVTETAASPPEEASAVKGRHLYNELGCAACHALGGAESGRLGPSFEGLYGSTRKLESGAAVVADDHYLRTSILDPSAEVVAGYAQEMPSFRGILSDADVESVIRYIKSLSSREDR